VAKAKPTYYLKIRSYPAGHPNRQDSLGRAFVSVWLLKEEGAGTAKSPKVVSGLLYGDMRPDLAEELAAALGLPVRREECPIPGAKPMHRAGWPAADKQDLLFGV
jgi:hypothetical protein